MNYNSVAQGNVRCYLKTVFSVYAHAHAESGRRKCAFSRAHACIRPSPICATSVLKIRIKSDTVAALHSDGRCDLRTCVAHVLRMRTSKFGSVAASAITSPYSFLQFFSTAMSRPSSPVVDIPAVTEEPLTATAIRSLIRQEVTAALRGALPTPAPWLYIGCGSPAGRTHAQSTSHVVEA